MSDNTIENTLWTEKYRPTTLDTYVGNDNLKKTIKHYIDNNDIPQLLLFGRAGTGKTTLGKIIANELDADLLYINASDENNIETIRTKIKSFVSSVGFKTWKIVMLDEADFMSVQSLAALRNIMEQFSNKSRFILTCNYVEKIIEPIRSRCNQYEIYPPSKKDVAMRMVDILTENNVEYSNEDLAVVINKSYPDIRSIINSLQQQSLNGKLELNALSAVEVEYMLKIKEALKSKDTPENIFYQIRQIIANARIRTFDDLYRYLYDNIEEIAPSGKRAAVIIEIAKAMQSDVWIVDREINVMACIVEILGIIKG